MIIFDELIHTNKLLKTGFSRFMSQRDLTILAKYYKYLGENPSQIRKKLVQFCKKHNSSFNDVLFGWKIDKAILSSKNSTLRFEKKVSITKNEFDTIKKLKNYKLEKILFIMIIVAKFFRKPENDLYINAKIPDIFSLAHVRASKLERNQIINKLNNSGYIKATLVGTFRIEFEDKDNNDEYIIVDNLKNIIQFYPIICVNCGKTIENKSKRHDLCSNCYKNSRKEDIRNYVQKHRENVKNIEM